MKNIHPFCHDIITIAESLKGAAAAAAQKIALYGGSASPNYTEIDTYNQFMKEQDSALKAEVQRLVRQLEELTN